MLKPIDLDKLDLKQKIVQVNRVAKVVKGGKRFSYSALVVVGDGHGYVGEGLGKANEAPDAIRKGAENASRNLILVPITGSTIPQQVEAHFGAAKVFMKPANTGKGVIAGGAMRAVMEVAGIHDVMTKTYGTSNVHNVVKATMAALKKLRMAEEVAKLRGKVIEDLSGGTKS